MAFYSKTKSGFLERHGMALGLENPGTCVGFRSGRDKKQTARKS
jgi:hypothetical protein